MEILNWFNLGFCNDVGLVHFLLRFYSLGSIARSTAVLARIEEASSATFLGFPFLIHPSCPWIWLRPVNFETHPSSLNHCLPYSQVLKSFFYNQCWSCLSYSQLLKSFFLRSVLELTLPAKFLFWVCLALATNPTPFCPSLSPLPGFHCFAFSVLGVLRPLFFVYHDLVLCQCFFVPANRKFWYQNF